ncbi:MAG: amidohydrolase [Bacteroidota bacterium]
MNLILKAILSLGLCLICLHAFPQYDDLNSKIDQLAEEIEESVVKWRRHIHQNPELSNREFKTAAYIAKHLNSLGLEVQTDIAHTGVVGILKGGMPGPVVGLRADMDALPVVERTPLPFASKVTSVYNGQDVGVMHACGHDSHVAILMGVASVLTEVKAQIPGTVKFIFQPAEEGAPQGEEGGAKLMVEEGALKNPDVDAIFGLHISSKIPVNYLAYRSGGIMASADYFEIIVRGKQTHGSSPWAGADPIVAAAHIITGLQTIVSRRMPLTQNAAVVTVGAIHGGVRNNIIPEEVKMVGTIRALDPEMQKEIHKQIHLTATNIAESMGTTAEVNIPMGAPVTYNDPTLTEKMLPTLKEVAGGRQTILMNATTGAEDFSFFQREVPGVYFFLGGMAPGKRPEEVASHHTPDFYIDESGFVLGIRSMARMALDYLRMK